MHREAFSRRSFLAATAAATVAQSADKLTVADVVERIQQHIGIPWRTETVDRVIAGDPNMPVTGIATAMMSTLAVLQAAASQPRRNLVITHEPTFYLHQERTSDRANDPAYNFPVVSFKERFIREHNLAIFRFHDHWHAMRPDGIAFGMTRELAWEKYADANDQHRFTFDGPPLGQLAEQIATRLDAHSMRVVGDPAMPVRRVLASWGYISRDPGIEQLSRADVDVLIGGEAREWEVVEYAQDAVAAGNKKALILIGHVASEQAGMKYCAEWLRTFITEVPVDFVVTPEPFWTPKPHLS